MTIQYQIHAIGLGSMRRCFLPVGQGAFYCESFMLDGASEPINVLFDCGTLPRGGMSDRIGKALAYALDGVKTIHLAFLSHLHDDHVNGLSVLKEQHHIKIKEIHYPAISDDDKFLMKFWYKFADQEKGPAWEFCLDPEALKRRFPESETKLVPVKATTPSTNDGEDAQNPNDSNKVPFPKVPIPDAEQPESTAGENPFLDWQFQTFNYRREELIQQLKEELKSALDLDEEVTDEILTKKWDTATGKKLIKRAYGKVMDGGFNTNSMVVFSGPKVKKGEEWYQRLICSHASPCRMNGDLGGFKPGCLYTGDYDASGDETWKELKQFYKPQWEEIGCLQVPHHGACLNFNSAFLEMNAIFIASAGANNKYGHPNACVRMAFQEKEKHLWCVTEHLASCLCATVAWHPQDDSCHPQDERREGLNGIPLKISKPPGFLPFNM